MHRDLDWLIQITFSTFRRLRGNWGMPGAILIERDPVLEDLWGDAKFEEIVGWLRSRRDEIQRRLGL